MNKYPDEFWTPEAIDARRRERRLNKWYRKKIKEQKTMGILMVLANLLVPTGAMFLLIPLGLWLVFSKEVNIY